MKILGYIFLVFGMMAKTYGLECYDCDITNWDGESTDSTLCLTPVDTGGSPTTTKTCPTDANGVVNYCFTQVTVKDGVVTEIHRDCAASNNDEDVNTVGAVPGANKCTSAIQTTTNPGDTTNCYFHCAADKCNTETTTALKQCSSVCNNGGACNYITGSCQCASGFSGADCTTVITPTAARQCVQCNSATDTGCTSSTTSAACPGTEQYCSTATTTILQGSTVVGAITTRGCSLTLKAVDECSFTQIYTDSPISNTPPGYKEYTCISTCNTDGCNTNTADGIIIGSEATLQCIVCSDTTGSGSCNPSATLPRTACPSSSTHCKSTVTYLLSKNIDTTYNEAVDAYQLLSVVRECASAAVNSSCTDTDVITGLKSVTCTETCQGDGCNYKWPTRPTCITCSSESTRFTNGYDDDGYDACLLNPPKTAVCVFPYEEYCVMQDMGIEVSKNDTLESIPRGYPRRMTRSCYFKDIGTNCSSETLRETVFENCNRTCTEDGCNVGVGGSTMAGGSTMILPNAFAVLVPTILGWFAQMHF